jgi:XTP/dITP diphosphohydrolase
LLVLADDSGLEVNCLDGAPGVRSARYADDQKFPSAPGSTPDERNNAALLRALDGVPEPCRQARYQCVLALARNGEIVATAEGAVEGHILTEPRGELGFGYDPLFFLAELEKTMAELDPATRLSLSHRGRALRALLQHSDLNQRIPDGLHQSAATRRV